MPEQNNNNSDQLWLMLGEIRADLKFLVAERNATKQRLDKLEEGLSGRFQEQEKRLGKLEAFKIRIGVITGILGVFVPTTITVIFRKLGLI